MVWKYICWKETLCREEEPVVELEFSVPLPVEQGRAEKRMGRYHARLAAVWYRRWTGDFYRAACGAWAWAREGVRPFWPWQARLSAELTYENDRICSLWMEGSERQGREEGRVVRTASTWTRRDGCPLTLGEICSGQRSWRRQALDQVEEGLRSMRREGVALWRDAERRAKAQFSPRRFYLTQDGLILYYPMGALGPVGSGILTFPLSTGMGHQNLDAYKIPEKV